MVRLEQARSLIERRYAAAYQAVPTIDFPVFSVQARNGVIGAALGFRRADQQPLFLEAYLDRPIELALTHMFERPIARGDIVEIGNLAAESAQAMIALWARAANDLGRQSEIAVAVLTAPLRSMLRRLGVVLHEIEQARPERLGAAAAQWGRYYDKDPIVCAGFIAEAQARLSQLGMRQTCEI